MTSDTSLRGDHPRTYSTVHPGPVCLLSCCWIPTALWSICHMHIGVVACNCSREKAKPHIWHPTWWFQLALIGTQELGCKVTFCTLIFLKISKLMSSIQRMFNPLLGTHITRVSECGWFKQQYLNIFMAMIACRPDNHDTLTKEECMEQVDNTSGPFNRCSYKNRCRVVLKWCVRVL